MLTLYYAPFACSLAPHIALEEAGAAYDVRPLAMRKGEHKSPDFLKVNPRGQVPALVVGDRVITQNVAILTYIARTHPERSLMPTETLAGAEALSWLSFLSSSVHPTFGPLFAPQYFVDEAGQEAFVAKARGHVEAKLADIDGRLQGRDWALGAFSVVDCYLVPFFTWAQKMGFDLSRYGNYTAHFERMSARPSVRKVLGREQEAMAQFDKAA